MPVFYPTNQGSVTMTADTVAASVALVSLAPDVLVTVTGAQVVHIRFGRSDVVATVAESVPVLAGTQQMIRRDMTETHVSAISAGGPSSITFSTGVGY